MSDEQDLQAWLQIFVSEQGGIAGTIHTIDASRESLDLRAAYNIPPKVQEITRVIPKGKGMAGLALSRHEPVFTCDLADDTNKDVRPGARAVNGKAAIAIPVDDASGAVRVVVGIAYPDVREFEPDTLVALKAAASQVP